ncbi:MAG: hypothetical protein HY978_03785 [Candidatus Liptonbacteria bacterium]|nr:hypothetical protein [Candidatus Liptonbacteria bacterium]
MRRTHLVLVLIVLAAPLLAGAACSGAECLWQGGYWGPLLSCTGTGPLVSGAVVTATCTSLCDLVSTAQNGFLMLLSFYFYILVPVFLIWGGFQIMISGGSTERYGKGIETIRRTAIGLAIALGAFVIINTFLWFLGLNAPGGGGVSWPNIQCNP